MTREEAVKIINCYDLGFYDLSGKKIPADKLAEAFYMATEALQTPPISQRSMYQAGYKQAQADRPKGYWIGDKCSVCGEERAWYGSNPPICPDCGADMRPTERGEEWA